MIEIYDYESGHLVKFVGEPQELPTFINLMTNLMKDTKYNATENGWIIPNLDELSNFFELGIEAESEPESYDDIGETMKLRPYLYQREAINFCLETKNALLVLPCGAGKK